jgi:hypothetical protein
MLDALKRTPDPVAAAAARVLEQPESYPGLCPLGLGETVFRLIEAPLQTWYPVSLWVMQLTASSALVRRVEWDRNLDRRFPKAAPHTFGADAEIPRDQADALVEELHRISICPFQPIRMGIDGMIQTIEFWHDGRRTASVSGWERSGERPELFAWLKRARTFFETHLPLSTAQNPQISNPEPDSYRPIGKLRER